MNEALKQQVLARAQRCCEYCRVPQSHSTRVFHVEHIVARQHGGESALANLALSCQDCNLHKGPNLSGIDPLTGQPSALFHPRQHVWAEHFRWNGATLEGATPTGRATIRVLDINSPARVVLRESLIEEGVFPPGF